MAVKAFGPASAFIRAFSPTPDSPWPHIASANATPGAAYSKMSFSEYASDGQARLGNSISDPDTILTPQELVAPSPSTSETGTVFSDVDPPAEEETTDTAPRVVTALEPGEAELRSATVRSPSNLTIDTGKAQPLQRTEDEFEPQSVIHIPSGFGRFDQSPAVGPAAPSSRASNSQTSRPASALSHASSVSAPSETASTVGKDSQISYASVASSTGNLSVQSDSTVKEVSPVVPRKPSEFYDVQMPPTPLQTSIPSAADWTSTPRAQTRQDLAALSRPGSSLASITEGDDFETSDAFTTDPSADEDEQRRSRGFYRSPDSEVKALKTALSECWTLCNTLANLSYIHRERIFTNFEGKGDMQEQAWKSCWKLCQNLYETRDETVVVSARPTLDLCRDFCQALFEVRVRSNDPADSVLRVSFELNNHLFNTHDRTLPEAFRERTLDFYITLCHRLMKQRSKLAEETDSLLKACWSLAEMLFSLRQSKREGRPADEELLGSAVQACWELCDLFREGWTQIRPDRGTPRPSQTTFSQAFHQAKKAGYLSDENGNLKLTPETPTTIFDDNVTISPDDPPVPNIMVLNADHLQIPTSARSIASAPPALPRPNTTQRISRPSSHTRQGRWNSLNSVVSGDEDTNDLQNAVSAMSRASSAHPSIASSAQTIKTPSEDPGMTLLKALFVRAAVQSGRGFSVDPRSVDGRDTSRTSLPLFARSLPENAFGSQPWQKNLLENYKKTIQNDSTFRSLGSVFSNTGIGADSDKGRQEIAHAVKGMVAATYGWGWLQDLFRYGYGTYVDDELSKQKEEEPKEIVRRVARQGTM